MKVWTYIGFEGHYPIGTAAVMVGDDRVSVIRKLNRQLKKQGLPGDARVKYLREVNTEVASCEILTDGDY